MLHPQRWLKPRRDRRLSSAPTALVHPPKPPPARVRVSLHQDHQNASTGGSQFTQLEFEAAENGNLALLRYLVRTSAAKVSSKLFCLSLTFNQHRVATWLRTQIKDEEFLVSDLDNLLTGLVRLPGFEDMVRTLLRLKVDLSQTQCTYSPSSLEERPS